MNLTRSHKVAKLKADELGNPKFLVGNGCNSVAQLDEMLFLYPASDLKGCKGGIWVNDSRVIAVVN